MIAQSIDIETAVYDGQISAPGQSSFTLTRFFRTATDDYVKTLDYINMATANGADDSGTAITGSHSGGSAGSGAYAAEPALGGVTAGTVLTVTIGTGGTLAVKNVT